MVRTVLSDLLISDSIYAKRNGDCFTSYGGLHK